MQQWENNWISTWANWAKLHLLMKTTACCAEIAITFITNTRRNLPWWAQNAGQKIKHNKNKSITKIEHNYISSIIGIKMRKDRTKRTKQKYILKCQNNGMKCSWKLWNMKLTFFLLKVYEDNMRTAVHIFGNNWV